MNGHIESSIDAYQDGELSTLQKQQVEAHLGRCSSCRTLLAQRKALTDLLQEFPPVAGLRSEARFVAEVGLQLKPRPTLLRLRPRAMRLSWQFIPLVLLFGLIFVQTVFILNSFSWLIPGTGLILLDRASSLTSLLTAPILVRDLLGMVGTANYLDWNWLTGMLAMLVISLLYVCWLASWWVRNRRPTASSI